MRNLPRRQRQFLRVRRGFRYPIRLVGWSPLTIKAKKSTQKMQPYLDKLGQVDLSQYAIIVFDPNSSAFTARLDVVVAPDVWEISDEKKEEMR